MTKSILTKVMLVGRATTFMVGLAVVLALTVGLASTALAGTGVGNILQLGMTNTVNQVTKLAGSVAGPSFQIDNNSPNGAATALDLQVEPGKPPMTVNSDAPVANLNADKLDGQDSSTFVRSNYYKVKNSSGIDFGNNVRYESIICDGDDIALSGGFGDLDAGTQIMWSAPNPPVNGKVHNWQVRWENDNTVDNVLVYVLCADVGTPRQ